MLLMLAPAVAEAENLAGVQKLICAPVTAADCPFGEACNPVTPRDIGVPSFVRIDLEKKQLIGPERISPIRVLENADDQLLLGGSELGFAWSMAIDFESGDMSSTVTDRDGAFVLHGACTAL
ncbi:MAG: hypothetical protein O7G13_02445 [Alphaproteobacteria bacterium]|nr:hypothetical protein [Alphaproteobacteria bacterium]